MRLTVFSVLGAPLILASCQGAEPDGRFSTVDSAGVLIVTNVAPQWREGEAWEVDATPLTDIGAEEGDPDDHLYQVRDAVRWQDGIVVINGVTDDLRVFDLDGGYKRTIGRQGGGPGEFKSFGFLRVLHADSLLTWDFGNDRISVFDASGAFVRSMWLQRDDAFSARVSPAEIVGHRQLLTMSRRSMLELGNETGRFVDSGVVAIHDLDGQLERILGLYPFGERVRAIRGNVITTLNAPFARSLQRTAWRDGYCFTFEVIVELSCRSHFAGEISHLFRIDAPPRAVTASMIDSYVEDMIANRPSQAYYYRQIASDIDFPESLPAVGDLKSDPSHNLWVADFAPPGTTDVAWRVFSPEGVYRGEVEMPDGLRVFRIYDDAVLGVWKDSRDVEHVRLHELIK